MNKHLIPIGLVAFDFIEAIICLINGDRARALYWASAGLITFSTVIMKG